MNFLFAWRYFRSKKSTNAVNIIAWVTVAAMAVGTAALVVVLSIFNGFEGLVKELYSSFYPDIRITSPTEKIVLFDAVAISKIKNTEGVAAYSLVAEENAHIQNGDFRTNAIMKGVDENFRTVTGVSTHLSNGNYNLGNDESPSLVLGSGIENALSLMSDRAITPVTVYLPRRGVQASANPLESISTVNFQPRGAFAIQQDFDNKYVITNLSIVKQMVGLKENEFTAAEIKLTAGASEKKVIEILQQQLGKNYLVENRYQQNHSLFAVMQSEKWAIYGILCLILIVAAFNMIGALTMLVLEKQQDIQIIKAMGGTSAFVQKIFLSEGALLAMTGSVIGILLALLFCGLQVTFKIIPLEGSFVIDYYPVKVMVTDLLLILLTVLVIAVIASWLPSAKAARQQLSLKAQ
ncbi:MAG: FtsX-like permease family protein [Chitinophagaceae bacterium]|nr:FtsX-like permease family protein [Chitinophagaceae bacterium]